MIRIKRVYDPPASQDGYRILVDRLWPRGLSKHKAKLDLWTKEVAPSPQLRKWFGHDPERWTDFKRRYAQELGTKKSHIETLRQKERAEGTITLLFAAHNEHFNNAAALREIVGRRKAVPTNPHYSGSRDTP